MANADDEPGLSADWRDLIERAATGAASRREVIGGLVNYLHTCDESIAMGEAFGTDVERWRKRREEVVAALRRLRGIP